MSPRHFASRGLSRVVSVRVVASCGACGRRLGSHRYRAVAERVWNAVRGQAISRVRHQGRARFAGPGVAGPGTFRSSGASWHGRHQRSAGRTGRAGDPPPGWERDRRRGGHGRSARRDLAERHWHRRRPLRHRLVGERQEAVRVELRRLGAGRLDASVLQRPAQGEERAEQWREFGDGTGRHFRIRRALEALRHDDLQGNVRTGGADRGGRLGPGRTPPLRSARRRQRSESRPGLEAGVPHRRSGARSLQHHSQSGAGDRRCGSSRNRAATPSTRARSQPPSSTRSRRTAA